MNFREQLTREITGPLSAWAHVSYVVLELKVYSETAFSSARAWSIWS